MKISFSRDYGTVTLAVDENNHDQDVAKCQALSRLFNSEDWLVFAELLGQVEQKYDEAVMKVRPQEQSFRETAVYAARKNGFCEAAGLLKKVLDAYAFYMSERKKALNAQIDSMLGKDDSSFND